MSFLIFLTVKIPPVPRRGKPQQKAAQHPMAKDTAPPLTPADARNAPKQTAMLVMTPFGFKPVRFPSNYPLLDEMKCDYSQLFFVILFFWRNFKLSWTKCRAHTLANEFYETSKDRPHSGISYFRTGSVGNDVDGN